jgi:hypothetical protein
VKLLACALLLGGCLRSTEFHCSDSTQCAGGVCQPVGFCSFENSGCPSGQRFGDSAGMYAGQCADGGDVDAGVDAVDDALEDAMIDSPADTSSACPATYAMVTGAPANRVYRLIAAAATWDAQRTACAADGATAYLAIPDDATELMAINTLAAANTDYWIGVSDQATEGTYLNVKGAAQTFLPWDVGQPNNVNNSDCVLVHQTNRTWNDMLCVNTLPAVCECEP